MPDNLLPFDGEAFLVPAAVPESDADRLFRRLRDEVT